MIERFYLPDSGTLTVDGIAIADASPQWLRKMMGLVSQEPVLFDGTIR